jgi:hypothetical protein
MSELGHHVLFWAAGLLAGTLLGWMLERRRVEAREPSREPRRIEQVGAPRSA